MGAVYRSLPSDSQPFPFFPSLPLPLSALAPDGTTARPTGRLDPFSDNVTYHPDTVSYASNLTSDVATGIGAWTDVQIDIAIRVGVDGVDKPMCEPMPVYATMSDQEVADIIAYLRSIPAVSQEIKQSSCPSQTGDPHDE